MYTNLKRIVQIRINHDSLDKRLTSQIAGVLLVLVRTGHDLASLLSDQDVGVHWEAEEYQRHPHLSTRNLIFGHHKLLYVDIYY